MSGIDCHWKLVVLSVRFICNRLVLLDLDVGQKCNQIRTAFISFFFVRCQLPAGVTGRPTLAADFRRMVERIFSEARQHHPELQPDSMSLSILRKSDRWPIILRPSWRFNWIRLSGPTSDARATPLRVDCR